MGWVILTTLPVTAQVQATNGQCWSATYTSARKMFEAVGPTD